MRQHHRNALEDPQDRDPFSLSDLPLLDPPADGWTVVRAALESDRRQRLRRGAFAGLAAAACLVLVVGLVTFQGERLLTAEPAGDFVHQPDREAGQAPAGAANDSAAAPITDQPAGVIAEPGTAPVRELIAFSQGLERRLRTLRNNTASMPAGSAVYLAELEDLVARVDSELSDRPDSVDLWSQRVNLMLDMEALFQHHFEREYGKMASL